MKKHKSWGVTSSNFGIYRTDYKKIGGFDEAYIGWGREDTDFFVRLIRAGVLRKEARSDVPVLHLWHPENSRQSLAQNEKLLEDTMSSDRIKSRKGINL